jgi:hypothetical protein
MVSVFAAISFDSVSKQPQLPASASSVILSVLSLQLTEYHMQTSHCQVTAMKNSNNFQIQTITVEK